MNKLLLVVALILSIISINMSSTTKSTTHFNNDQIIKVKKDDEISSLKLEEYIIGVVASEMPASFHIEALKAQAISARTYALYKMNESNGNYDILASITNQGYINKEEMQVKWLNDYDKYYNKIKEAVLSTKGLVVTYNGNIVPTYYFAMSNGYTEEAKFVFGENKDYLVSVKSEYDNESLKNFKKTIQLTKDAFCNALALNCDILKINNIERSATHRVIKITINDKEFKGTKIRELLALRSTDFTISISEDIIYITTSGYGHGVGMSQYGANGMANNGYTYDQILKYYYKDIEINKI